MSETPNYSDAEPISGVPGTVDSAEAPTIVGREYIPPDSPPTTQATNTAQESTSAPTAPKEFQPVEVTSTPVEGLNAPEVKGSLNVPQGTKVGITHHEKPPQTGLFQFSNTDAIKEKVRAAKFKPNPYNVHDFYHKTGFFQWVAKHPVFENTTLGIIVLNALWLSFDTDGNTADTILDAEPIYIAADSLFFGYFSIELFIRFMAFKKKCSGLRDPWFVFDTTLVTLYLFDPFTIGLMAALSGGGGLNLPTAVLRLFRLARLSRLVRMLRSLPELMIMIKGMITATKSVGYTLALLMLINYIFSIALRNLSPVGAPSTDRYFSSVPEAMHNLVIFTTFGDALSEITLEVKADSSICFVLVWVFVCLAMLTVMNMLIGVLCEVIAAVAEEEKEGMMVDKVNEKFADIVKELDTSGDGTLSWDEFQMILDFPQALKALESVNVDAETMVDMAEDFFFEDGEKVDVTFEQFMEMVLDLRGGQNATVESIMTLAKRFNNKFLSLKTRLDNMDDRLENIGGKLDSILGLEKFKSWLAARNAVSGGG